MDKEVNDIVDRLIGEDPGAADEDLVDKAGVEPGRAAIKVFGCFLSLGGFLATIGLMVWAIWWVTTRRLPGGDVLRWSVVGVSVIGSLVLVAVLPGRATTTLLHGLVAWAKARLHIGTVSEGGSSVAIPSMTEAPPKSPVPELHRGPVGTRLENDAPTGETGGEG